MRFDFVAFLGGLTAGAAGAALFSAGSKQLGWSGGGPSGGPGGFGGGSYAPGGFGPGVVSGPPSGGGTGPVGPSIVSMGPEEEDGGRGPVVSVPPIIHDGQGAFGGSFFGVNVAPWFWPLNILPVMQLPRMPQDEEIVCKKSQEDDEETFVCRRKYPVQSVAWGPPAVWL